MALSKVNKSYLLVATIAGGITFTTINSISKLHNQIDSLQENTLKMEKSINDMERTIKQKDDIINNMKKEKDDIINENKSLKDTKEELKKENKALQQKLEAKKEKEASVALASTEYPTESVSRGLSSRGTPITITLSFYGDFASENGGYSGIDAQGNKLIAGTVASNVYSFGTQFYLNGQIFTVRDRGGSHFSSPNRLDVFVPRNPGESNSSYRQRILQYGKKTVVMYKL